MGTNLDTRKNIPKSGLDRLFYLVDAFRYHWAAREPQLVQYRKDLLMRIGEQWDPEDIAILDKNKKPHLTFNHIGRLADLLSGFERSQRKQVVALPIDEDDIDDADVVSNAIRFIDAQSDAEHEKSEVFDDALSMGEGILGVSLDPVEDEYRIAHESVFVHVPDRDCIHRTWDTATVHFRTKFMSLQEIRNKWPSKAEELANINPSAGYMMGENGKIDYLGASMYPDSPTIGASVSNYQGDYAFNTLPDAPAPDDKKSSWSLFYQESTKRYRVVEVYEVIYVPSDFIVETLADGSEVALEEIPWTINKRTGYLERQDEKVKKFVEQSKHFKITTRSRPKVRLTVFAGDVTLEDGFTIFSRIPFVPYYWMLKHDGIRKHVQGFVRRIVDPQDAYNKTLSQEMHAINTATGFIMIINKQLLRGETPDTFKAALQNFNAIITTEATSMKEGVDYTIIKPGEPPYQLFANIQRLRDEIPLLAGIDEQSFMGQGVKGDPSGWALEVKQKQQVMQIATPFDNAKAATLTLYKKVVWPLLKNSSVTMRIRKQKLSTSEQPEMQSLSSIPINMPTSELTDKERTAFGITAEDVVNSPDRKVNDLSIVDVDIKFDETALSSTERQHILGYLLNMAKAGMAVPPTMIFEYMDEPVAQKLLTSFKRAAAQAQSQQGQGQPPGSSSPPPQMPGGSMPSPVRMM